jgi:hypothetical protein
MAGQTLPIGMLRSELVPRMLARETIIVHGARRFRRA